MAQYTGRDFDAKGNEIKDFKLIPGNENTQGFYIFLASLNKEN